MAKIIVVTGGVRSGKSVFAEKLMLDKNKKLIYLATCPNIDSELDKRIVKHRQRRQSYSWETVEEQLDISGVIAQNPHSSYLVECLTLWVNNLMYAAELSGQDLTEKDISQSCEELIEACSLCSGTLLFVTNETGMGIMPENKVSRKFGDLAGRCNQLLAAAADEVYLLVSGIPLKIKGEL
jgi:adenosylcobinamide kinase / adenosylcobinamide-phosphate guanylyltransferase